MAKPKVGLTVLQMMQEQEPEHGFSRVTICQLLCEEATPKCSCSWLTHFTKDRYVSSEKYIELVNFIAKLKETMKKMEKEHTDLRLEKQTLEEKLSKLSIDTTSREAKQ